MLCVTISIRESLSVYTLIRIENRPLTIRWKSEASWVRHTRRYTPIMSTTLSTYAATLGWLAPFVCSGSIVTNFRSFFSFFLPPQSRTIYRLDFLFFLFFWKFVYLKFKKKSLNRQKPSFFFVFFFVLVERRFQLAKPVRCFVFWWCGGTVRGHAHNLNETK
jgi:hypothetical protein